jgi:hypothetical protein
MTETIHDWNPDAGDLCQGDVLLFRLPEGLAPVRADIIHPRDGKLILAEGEVTGHHHAIWFNPPMFRDDGLARALAPGLHDDLSLRGGNRSGTDMQTRPAATTGMATLYRDEQLVHRLVDDGLLTEGSLCVGFLVVEAPALLRHQEHDAVRIPPGTYYVGQQREFHAGEARRVAD